MDITDVILRQHDEQRRMFSALEEWPRDDHEGLDAVWKRLEILLEVHAEAEERYFYPELLRLGTGGADAESVDEEVEDAIHDHNKIREAVRDAAAQEPASPEWWEAVGRARTENSKHIGEEEREALPDMRLNADTALLDELGLRWLEYRAEHERVPDVPAENKDADEYIAEHEPG